MPRLLEAHMAINVNDTVRVRLTAKGEQIWAESKGVLGELNEHDELVIPFYLLLAIFGPHVKGVPLFMGGDVHVDV